MLHTDLNLPEYRGLDWIEGELPQAVEAWPKFNTRKLLDLSGDDYDVPREEIVDYAKNKPWAFPDRNVFFLCDVHADTDALHRGLVASGGVEKTGPGDGDLKLTETGKGAVFVIGGDCFDKGPENLRLLRALHGLIDKGVQIEILAGNHDVRALLGFAYAGEKEPRLAHLFVRMGKKSIPLFREIWDQYLSGNGSGNRLLTDAEVRERYFPGESWYEEFPEAVRDLIPAPKIRKEVQRIREKVVELTDHCREMDMTLGMVHAAFEKARELFLLPGGEFRWFFERMNLAWRGGSFLFIHAGVDDEVAGLIRAEGVEGLNRTFLDLMETDLFELYHGPIGNTFRTKYRPEDLTFTTRGVYDLHQAGIYAIVHGHRNILRGQRIVFREGILNWECDASVDRNTRRIHDLETPGGAVTVFRPDGTIFGLSTDYPYVKVFRGAKIFRSMVFI